jgi:hypothetical protein
MIPKSVGMMSNSLVQERLCQVVYLAREHLHTAPLVLAAWVLSCAMQLIQESRSPATSNAEHVASGGRTA